MDTVEFACNKLVEYNNVLHKVAEISLHVRRRAASGCCGEMSSCVKKKDIFLVRSFCFTLVSDIRVIFPFKREFYS